MQLKLEIEVVNYIQDDDCVDIAEIGVGDISDLEFRAASQRALRSPDILTTQFNASV